MLFRKQAQSNATMDVASALQQAAQQLQQLPPLVQFKKDVQVALKKLVSCDCSLAALLVVEVVMSSCFFLIGW